jgi:hypothetical protein
MSQISSEMTHVAKRLRSPWVELIVVVACCTAFALAWVGDAFPVNWGEQVTQNAKQLFGDAAGWR